MLPGAHRVAAKGRVYWYAWRGGPQIWAGPAEAEGEAALAIVHGWHVARDHRPAEGTVARLLHDYERSDDHRRLAPATRALYAPDLAEAARRLGDLPVALLASRTGRERIRQWRASIASDRRADQVLTVIGAVARYGRSVDLLPPDCHPCADMRRRYVAPPQEAWTEEELARAVAGLPPHLSRVVRLAVETGLRRTDLCALTWTAVDTRAGVIRWRTSKSRRAREAVIDLTPALREVLLACPRKAVTVLTTSTGTSWTVQGLKGSLRRALARLGIERGLHGLRRLTASRLSAQGLSDGQIARRLGWSTTEVAAMLATYVDPAAEALARKAGRND